MSTEPTREELVEAVRTLAFDSGDLGMCPYYTQVGAMGAYGPNTCTFGCSDEPECRTCEPEDGWLVNRLPASVRTMLIETVADSGLS